MYTIAKYKFGEEKMALKSRQADLNLAYMEKHQDLAQRFSATPASTATIYLSIIFLANKYIKC